MVLTTGAFGLSADWRAHIPRGIGRIVSASESAKAAPARPVSGTYRAGLAQGIAQARSRPQTLCRPDASRSLLAAVAGTAHYFLKAGAIVSRAHWSTGTGAIRPAHFGQQARYSIVTSIRRKTATVADSSVSLGRAASRQRVSQQTDVNALAAADCRFLMPIPDRCGCRYVVFAGILHRNSHPQLIGARPQGTFLLRAVWSCPERRILNAAVQDVIPFAVQRQLAVTRTFTSAANEESMMLLMPRMESIADEGRFDAAAEQHLGCSVFDRSPCGKPRKEDQPLRRTW